MIRKLNIQPLIIAALITWIQLTLVLTNAAPTSLFDKWWSLFCWDSGWYISIVETGYVSTIPPAPQNSSLANVAFFPAYPLTCAFISKIFSLSSRSAMLLVSQFSCVFFWLFYLLVADRLKLKPVLQWVGVLFILSFPTAFFLVTAYSESMFMASGLGVVYFYLAGDSIRQKFGKCLSGIILSASRISGIFIPFTFLFGKMVRLFLKKISKRQTLDLTELVSEQLSWPDIWIPFIATLGTIGFFAYCQIKWGMWNLYMETQRIGWGVVPHYFAIFSPSTWFIPFPLPSFFEDIDSNQVSYMMTVLFSWFLLITFLIDAIWKRKAFLESPRLPLYLSAATIFLVSMAGTYGHWFISMSRYVLPVFVLMLLGILHLVNALSFEKVHPRLRENLFLALFGICLGMMGFLGWTQLMLIRRFTSGQWVA